jgi:hypothetical protein
MMMSTGFLVGPKKQCQTMCTGHRAAASSAYFASMVSSKPCIVHVVTCNNAVRRTNGEDLNLSYFVLQSLACCCSILSLHTPQVLRHTPRSVECTHMIHD